MNLDIDFSNLTLDNIGSWPKSVRLIAIVAVSILILGLAYWFDTSKQITALDADKAKERTLKEEFEDKQQQAANLQAYQNQLTQMRISFGEMLRQLPGKTEVPSLLEDVSKAGVASGLEFTLFAPQPEVQHDFYAELPIRLSVVGTYHQLATFVSSVASLDRIVTLHDFKISPYKEEAGATPNKNTANLKKAGNVLTMEMVAKTYRYLESGKGGD